MTEPLDASVTVEEIFAVVGARRVPLAPELAGYLVLEVAENVDDGLGEIDPGRIHVGDEGTVAIVKPRGGSGDTQVHLRRLLGKLLDASGTQTAALTAVAKKIASGGTVEALVEELEAALIPVNRSAGRRALARLARETKRVTLRVGRNAAPPSRDPSRDSIRDSAAGFVSAAPPPPDPQPRSERPPPSSASFDAEEVPTTARREIPSEVLEDATTDFVRKPLLREEPSSLSELPTVGIAKEELDAARATTKRDSVDSLLDKFEVSGASEEKAVSRELKAIAGLDPTPPPPTPRSDDDGIESLLEVSAPARRPLPAPKAPPKAARPETKPETRPAKRRSEPPPARAPEPARSAPKTRDRAPSFADDRQLPTAPSQLKRGVSVSSEIKPPRSTRDRNLVIALLLLLVVLAVVLWTMKPGFLTGRTPEKVEAERLAAEAESARLAALPKPGQCRANLVVEGAPKDAEILLRVGQGPADVDHMPAGTRLEFVALADGFAPKRAVVPATTWDSSGGRPRYELAMQLDKSKAKPGANDPWPPVEPGSEVGGKGAPGIVHVITTPKGAELWLLAGLGPDASIEDFVQCDSDADVLVAIGTKRTRYHVEARSFVPDGSKPNLRVAKLSVK